MADKNLLDLNSSGNVAISDINDSLVEENLAELWIVAGQSNCVGNCDQDSNKDLYSSEPGLYLIDLDGSIRLATYPFHVTQVENPLGDYFHGRSGALDALRLRAAQGGRRIVVLSAAYKGSGLHWNSLAPLWYGPAAYGGDGLGGTLYQEVVTRANAALALDSRLFWKGLIWHQGEADSIPAVSGADYISAFNSMLDGWRAEINADFMNNRGQEIVVIGQLTPYNLANGYSTYAASEFQEIDNAVQVEVAKNPFWAFVRSDGLNVQADNIHFDVADQAKLGYRYFSAIKFAEMNCSGEKPLNIPIPEFSATKGYSFGETITYNGYLYRANKNVPPGSFNIADWDKNDYDPETYTKDDVGAAIYLTDIKHTLGADTLGTAATYSAQFAGEAWRAVDNTDPDRFAYQCIGDDLFHTYGETVAGNQDLTSAIGVFNGDTGAELDRAYARAFFGPDGKPCAELVAYENLYVSAVIQDCSRVSAHANYADLFYKKAATLNEFGIAANRVVNETHIAGHDKLELYCDERGLTNATSIGGSFPPTNPGRTTVRVTRTKVEIYKNTLSNQTAGNILATIDAEGIELHDSDMGLILKSPNGTRFKIKVDNAGTLTTTLVV